MTTRVDIARCLRDNNIVPMIAELYADNVYACPTLDWIQGDFASQLRSMIGQLGLNTWREEENDCDEFARFGAWFANFQHFKGGVRKGTALAVGELWYESAARGGHAINVFIIGESNRAFSPVFFEPQEQRTIHLTEAEEASCRLVRF